MVDIKLGGFRGGNNITAKVTDAKGRFLTINVPNWKSLGTWDSLVATERARPDVMGTTHSDDLDKRNEMVALYNLVKNADFTDIMHTTGNWSDGTKWVSGSAPAANAKVLIPSGVTCTYDVTGTPPDLDWVRVRGTFYAHRSLDTAMQCEHFITDMGSTVDLGTEASPLTGSYTHIISDRGDIDVDVDTTLIGRGVITHGTVDVYGKAKTEWLRVASKTGNSAGNTTITLESSPSGWEVGDRLVISGTNFAGWDYQGGGFVYLGTEDEEVTITGISGSTVTFTPALSYTHDTLPIEGKCVVANLTRNIVFKSENEDSAEIHHRGHTMFMHNGDVRCYYAAFEHLGRTNKAERSFHHYEIATKTATSNVRARYPFHFHRVSVDRETPGMAYGCVVYKSPGWGFVHHDSNADFRWCVGFDILGAHFVGEDGNELGAWDHCLAIKAKGASRGYGEAVLKNNDDKLAKDFGRYGEGFIFTGRQVETTNCVAMNCKHGYVWAHRFDIRGVLKENAPNKQIYSKFGPNFTELDVDNIPIQNFADCEAGCCDQGLNVNKSGPSQGHSQRTHMARFHAWGTLVGAQFNYTGHYTMTDFTLSGYYRTARNKNNSRIKGAAHGANTFDMVWNGLTVDNFPMATDFDTRFNITGYQDGLYRENIGHVVIDLTETNCGATGTPFNTDDAFTLITSGDLGASGCTHTYTGATSTTYGGTVEYTAGNITDSIGSRPRGFVIQSVETDFIGDKGITGGNTWERILEDEGFYEEADGSVWLPFYDCVEDRATTERNFYVRYFEITDRDAATWEGQGYTNLGPKPA